MVQQSTPKQKRWGKQRPYYGTVVAIEGLCKIMSAEDKDTIRVEVQLPNMKCTKLMPEDFLHLGGTA